MVAVVQGHVLTDYNATKYIVDWFDGQLSQTNGEALSKSASSGVTDGYKAPYGTLPPLAQER